MPGADVVLYEKLFNAGDSDRLFSELDCETQWRQDQIQVFGKKDNLPDSKLQLWGKWD
jgi:hypothetical protein